MKKKFFALMMAMLMVLSLAACGGKEDPPAPGTDAPAASGEAAFCRISKSKRSKPR